MYPVLLHNKLYKNKRLIGCNITIIRYNRKTTRCELQTINIDTKNIISKLHSKEIIHINFVLWKNGIIAANKYESTQCIIKETAIKMRKFLEIQYGIGTDLCGHCIEASEYMEKILRFKGYTTSRGGIVFGEMGIMVQIDLMMNIHSWNWEANTIWT